MKRNSLAEQLWKAFVRLHIVFYRLLRGRVGKHTVVITTIGRKSRQPRTNVLYSVKDGSDYVVIASYGGSPKHPDWYLNLRADPHAIIEDHGRAIETLATVVENEEERKHLWSKMTAIYPSYDDYQQHTTRKIPVVRLRPQQI